MATSATQQGAARGEVQTQLSRWRPVSALRADTRMMHAGPLIERADFPVLVVGNDEGFGCVCPFYGRLWQFARSTAQLFPVHTLFQGN